MSARRVALAALCGLLCAGRAQAVVVEGTISHPDGAARVADIPVQAIGIDESEQTILRETRTDAKGRYRFDDLPSPAAYLVRARFGGVTFPGGSAVFRRGESEAPLTRDFEVYDPTPDASGIRLAAVEWVIERNAGTWRLLQSARVANAGQRVVLAPADAPAPLALALAPGHGEIESAFGRLPDGVVVKDDRAELRGPILPGAEGFSLQLAYELPGSERELATEITLPSAVDELRVYVQDFGIDVDAGRLHPSRPARPNDVVYQAFLGFDLPAGTKLPLRVRALPPAPPAPQALVALLAALLAGGILYLVVRPLLGTRAIAGPGGESHEPSPGEHALAAALADLEHDFETGKLSTEDHARLRADLEREAVAARALVARAREVWAPEVDAGDRAATVPAACSCGRAFAAADRFCSACGKPR